MKKFYFILMLSFFTLILFKPSISFASVNTNYAKTSPQDVSIYPKYVQDFYYSYNAPLHNLLSLYYNDGTNWQSVIDYRINEIKSHGQKYLIMLSYHNLPSGYLNYDLSNVDTSSLSNVYNLYFGSDTPFLELNYESPFLDTDNHYYLRANFRTFGNNPSDLFDEYGNKLATGGEFYNLFKDTPHTFGINETFLQNGTFELSPIKKFWSLYVLDVNSLEVVSTDFGDPYTSPPVEGDPNNPNFWDYETCSTLDVFCKIRNFTRWVVNIAIPVSNGYFDENGGFSEELGVFNDYLHQKFSFFYDLTEQFNTVFDNVIQKIDENGLILHIFGKDIVILNVSFFAKYRDLYMLWFSGVLWVSFAIYLIKSLSGLFNRGGSTET